MTAKLGLFAVLALAVMGCGLGVNAYVMRPGGPKRPILIGREDGRNRKVIFPKQRYFDLLRIDGATSENPYWDQEFDIVVDSGGAVVSAKYSADGPFQKAPETLQAEAEAQLRSWKFEPFLKDGRPVYVKFRQEFEFVPPPEVPGWHVPFPEIRNLEGVVISLSRWGPYHPPYIAIIRGNGVVDLMSGSVQVHHGNIDQADVGHLIEKIRQADFFSLQRFYSGGPTDGDLRTLTVDAAGPTKTVIDYYGEFTGMPDSVAEIEATIERMAETKKQIDGE